MLIDSARTQPGIPSGSGAALRNAILFVASKNSSSVTRSSSPHFVVVVVPLEEEDGHDCLASLSCRGNKVPMTLASNIGSMCVVSGEWGRRSNFSVTNR